FAYVTNFVNTADGDAADGFLSIIDTATDTVLPVRVPVGEFPAAIAIAGISPPRVPTPVDTPTQTPTDTDTATATPTDTPMPTSTPTPTINLKCCTDSECDARFCHGEFGCTAFCVFNNDPSATPIPECIADPTICNSSSPPAGCGECN